MRPRRVWAIAVFELRATITRPGFIATTFLLPVVLLGLSLGSVGLQGTLLAARMTAHTTWGVVDGTGTIARERADERTTLVPFRTRDDAVAALRAHAVDGFVVVPADYRATGRVDVYAPSQRSPFDPPPAPPDLLVRALVERLLEGVVDDEVRVRVLDPASPRRFVVTAREVLVDRPERVMGDVLHTVMPIVFGVLFLTALLTASGYLVQAVAADKETRVAEVLLASVTADEILFGKLVGLGTAGLMQLAVWCVLSSGGAAIAGAGLALASGLVPLGALVAAPLLFVAGYFFLGSLMLVTGALGSNAAEAQKLSVAWALLGVAPTFFLVSFMDAPHGAIPRALSLVPTSAPLALMLRIGLDPAGVAWWELPLALAEIALCTYVVLRLGARLFAFGLLRTTLPGPREIVRALLRRG